MKYLLLVIFVLSCQAPTEQAELRRSPSASVGELSPSRWASSTNFPLRINAGADFNPAELQAIESALGSWNKTNSNEITFFDFENSSISSRNHLDDYKDSELGIYKIFSWPDEMPGSALAVTQIFGKRTSDGFITINHADILLNYDYFDFSATDEWGYDLETVVLHELGHFLGLYHENSSADESVMYPTISRYNNNRLPHSHDEEELAQKYARLQLAAISSPIEEDVTMRLEIYPDGSEKIKIQRSK